jgi:hypothetical protein
MKISYAMRHMLQQVRDGCWWANGGGEPFMIGNTNRTAESLETRGLIRPCVDQTEARKTLRRAYELTPAGAEIVGYNL